ncbi:MAG: helix-turn-helix domain-containing protein [Blautia sp.]|nr:helix-turn-helix domain-containing protein [Blautia sp.]
MPKLHMTQGEQNLLLLESLLPKSEKLYIWCYDQEGKFIASSCPRQECDTLNTAFSVLGGKEKALRYAGDHQQTRPMIIGSSIDMQWAFSYGMERDRHLFYVIGTVFYNPPQTRQVRSALQPAIQDHETSVWAGRFLKLLPELPMLSYAVFIRYVIMIHNTLTGQQLGIEDLDRESLREGSIEFHPAQKRDRSKVYQAEQILLQMVRTGNISYQNALQHSTLLSPGVPVQGKDPLRQAKTSIVVFTTLVSRAAIEGGLSPEIAYPLVDSYLQAVEDCRDSGELNALANAMYHDFIYRVHLLHSNPNYSPAIQKCCDYIELNLNQKIRTHDLAVLTGYTEYYLTEKFKKETGQSVSSYIRQIKTDRARILLTSSDLSVREISDRLAFNTVNYFIQSFRDSTGLSPAQYRKQHRSIGSHEKSGTPVFPHTESPHTAYSP